MFPSEIFWEQWGHREGAQGGTRAAESHEERRGRQGRSGHQGHLEDTRVVEHASVLINRYLVGKDGKTAYERLRGKKPKMLGSEFGERASTFGGFPCMAGSESSTACARRDSSWDTGRKMASTWRPTARGAYKRRAVQRIPETERWDKSGIEGMPWAPWKFKASGGTGSPGEADCAGPDSFLDIEIGKSISMPAPPRVEEDAVLLESTHHAGGAKPVWHNGRLCAMRQQYHWRNGNPPFRGVPQDREGDEKRSRTRRVHSGDGERAPRLHRVTPRSSRSTRARRKNRSEQMDAVGSGGMKRKAEDNQETEPMEVMDCCMCENVNDVNTVEEDDTLEKYKADDCMQETRRNWADMTEEEHTEQKTFFDDLTGKALKHEKVIDARLDDI